MIKEGRWIYLKKVEHNQAKRKTDIYNLHAKQGDGVLGQVKWYGPWRQYTFFPKDNTLYEPQCLMDIAKMLHSLMQERKLERQLIKS